MTPEYKIRSIEDRLKTAYSLLAPCEVCPRRCGINRLKGETGFCGMGKDLMLSSHNLHFGEEPPISGTGGSGTLFLTGCSLKCVFCQNYPISQLSHGNRISIQDFAEAMLDLQKRGAHNINFVTPTHFAPQIMDALRIAYRSGLSIPLVYNCSGYESLAVLKLWEGIMDIYMPDMKYADPDASFTCSSARDYPLVNRAAVLEMHRQVGLLELDSRGIAKKGLLIRHLVLPGNLSGTEEILRFISEKISPDTHISLMRQYFPAHRADSHPLLKRRITDEEYEKARIKMEEFGLTNGWIQE